MVKKLLFALLLVLCLLPVAALGEQVIDDANILTPEEEQAITEAIQWMEDRAEIDVVVLTTYATPEDNTYDMRHAMAFADDYYDYNGYGKGADFSGMLFLVDMHNRIMWISTCGSMIQTLSDSRIEAILDVAYDEAASGNYGSAVLKAMKKTQRYVHNTVSGVDLLVAGAAFAAVAAIIFTTVNGSYNLKGVTYSYNAQQNARVDMRQDDEEYLRQSVTRAIRASSSGSGGGRSGGSRTHRSSSGRSHGGGGRRF